MAEYHAWLIGNWAYAVAEGGAMPVLTGPKHDLAVMQAALEHQSFGLFGGRVHVHKNLTDAQLRTELSRAAKSSKPGDALLIYYSGHGERKGNDQRLGLVGVDVPLRDAGVRALDFRELREWLDDARASSKVVILDCCYSGQVRGGLVEEEVLTEFAEGTYVLSSGGNQVVTDAMAPDSPSPFTSALSEVLVDERFGGEQGLLHADAVYELLDRWTPPLPTPPKRNVAARGQFVLARRPKPAEESEEPPGWQEPTTTRVSVEFEQDRVTATWDQDQDGHVTRDERDVTALDPHRLAAVRRLSQLADAVMRAEDYRGPEWQAKARRALDTAAANLFHTAMPPDVRSLLGSASKDPHKLVRLDLSFTPTWATLTDCPWEYLHVPSVVPGRSWSRPVRTGLIVSRVGGSALETGTSSPPDDIPSVAVVNTLRAPFDKLAMRLADEVVAMPTLRAVNIPKREPARWADFMMAVDQKPHILVLCAPLTRADQNLRIGFDRAKLAEREPDWRDTESLAAPLESVSGLRLVVLVTLAGYAGVDAFRAAPAVARDLSDRLEVPVVFVCHTPGLESHVGQLQGTDPQTLLGLFLAAYSKNKDLCTSLWYARERVLRYLEDDFIPNVGMPGVVEPALPPATHRPQRSPGPRLSPGRMTPRQKGS